MTQTRRNFIRKSCIGGICLCGFHRLYANDAAEDSAATGNGEQSMPLVWIGTLLSGLENCHTDELTLRQILKPAAIAHYNQLEMDVKLAPFLGKPDDFIAFLEKEWGWIVSYDESGEVLYVDENKAYCVCPLLSQQNEKEKHYPALCFCSEGFAERMFTTVYAKEVRVTVISSIQRKNERCIYKIELNPEMEKLS